MFKAESGRLREPAGAFEDAEVVDPPSGLRIR